ncbi:hypothetical protein FACS1894166_08900 [Bacilli bacterium]|nr:hypothetical protein FACS1894166_08900 [Bacilli bacterium]
MMTNADEEMFNRILTFFEDENIASLFLNLPPTSKDDFYARIYAGFKIKLNIDQTG